MSDLKVLFRVSLALLFINLFLVGLVVFNHIQSEHTKKDFHEKISQSEVKGASSVPVFSPSMVVSNEGFTSTRACPNVQAVQDILNRYNSPLRNYSVQGRSAASWIFAAARGETSSKYGVTPQLNPCMLIAFLEKEQSLLSGQFSGVELENRLGIAMGYGCPDYAACDAQYKGFVNQLNWASYQLQFNYNLAGSSSSVDAYQVNRTIYTLDGFNVYIENAGTGAAYRYTPNVYWGNYNLWKIMTANGWGASPATYNMADIDAVNVPNRANLIQDQINKRIPESAVANLLNNPPAMGTQNSQVELLQSFLRQEGYYTFPVITGYYGTITDSARKAYLADSPKRATQSSVCDPLYTKTWVNGQSGAEVEQLQKCLKAEGVYAWPTITGFYGPVTEQGLNTIRSRKGLIGGGTTTTTPSNPTPTTAKNVQFITSSNGVATKGLNMRDSACGKLITTIPWNTQGTGLEGPISKSCFGGNFNWIRVSFANGQTGWVADAYLNKTTSTPPTNPTAPNSGSQTNTGQTTFKSNSRGTAINALNIRDSACGRKINEIGWNSNGKMLSGPVNKACFGGTWDWYEVDFGGGKSGWVAGFYLDVISGNSNSGQKFVTDKGSDPSSALNVRNSPCGQKIDTIGWNQQVVQTGSPITQNCFGRNITWYQVVMANGKSGWVAGDYLKKV